MFGTNTTLDLAVSRFQYVNMSVEDFGEKNLADGIAAMLGSHNMQVADIMGDLCGSTTERLLMYGSGDTTQMIESDEFTTPPPQKARGGVVVGLPLKKYTYSWQGTRQYFRKASVYDVMQNTLAMMDADRRNLINQVRLAIFPPTNYTFSDDLVDHLTATPLPVKRLVNADGLAIPPGPNGESFNASTHTHYLGTSSFVAADMLALKETVLEHYSGGDAMFCIPRPLSTTIATFTGNFVPLTPQPITQPTTAASIDTPGLNVISITNREIGLFDGIPVWIKPWMPAGMVLFFIKSAAGKKVCMVRTDGDDPGSGQLALNYEHETYPLRARYGGRDFGVGVWERTAAAILDTANASYTAPTLTTY
jgi:hypothetical protein